MLTLIVARARNGAIGRDGDMPWHIPEDLAFFQRETRGGAVIMGRRTWESLPAAARPLKGRLNLVVSRNLSVSEYTAATPEKALALSLSAGHRRIYGIGGASIYAALLPVADRLLITEVDMDVPDADTFFPDVDLAQWRSIGSTVLREQGPACAVHEYLL